MKTLRENEKVNLLVYALLLVISYKWYICMFWIMVDYWYFDWLLKSILLIFYWECYILSIFIFLWFLVWSYVHLKDHGRPIWLLHEVIGQILMFLLSSYIYNVMPFNHVIWMFDYTNRSISAILIVWSDSHAWSLCHFYLFYINFHMSCMHCIHYFIFSYHSSLHALSWIIDHVSHCLCIVIQITYSLMSWPSFILR